MANMRVFQIIKNEVLIINNDKQYTDTLENFKLDSGLTLDNLNEIIYDNYQECCVVNKDFLEYPNADFDGYINNIDTYIAAKAEREYVPPKEPTAEEKLQQQASETKAQLMEQKDTLLMAMLTGTDTAPVVANYAVMLTSVDDSVAEKIPEVFPAWDGNSKDYKMGDRVIYNGKIYESTIDNNVWSPADYPAGWKEIEE